MKMLLNCDLGEIEDPGLHIERTLMPLIDIANIACGFHAGNPLTMHNALAIVREHGVMLSAHPGYGDRDNFGRISIPHSRAELSALLHYQLSALEGMARLHGLTLAYVKPHGALYNDMMKNADIRRTVLEVMAERDTPRTLVMLANDESERHREEAARHGLEVIFETFADRCYTAEGFLMPRTEPGAVHDRDTMLAQVRQLCEDGTVTANSGEVIAISAQTLCIHGDTPEAAGTARDIRQILDS